jgi:hypothetical protein
MKPSHKLILAACLAVPFAATLTGCASTTLEQQIAVKEAGSWDFKSGGGSTRVQYVRIYDTPGKVGWSVFEYGQKSPCNQGFQKVTKKVAPGLVEYSNAKTKSFACGSQIRYVFRTDANGHPYEGWGNEFTGREIRDFPELAYSVKWWDANNMKPTHTLMQ